MSGARVFSDITSMVNALGPILRNVTKNRMGTGSQMFHGVSATEAEEIGLIQNNIIRLLQAASQVQRKTQAKAIIDILEKYVAELKVKLEFNFDKSAYANEAAFIAAKTTARDAALAKNANPNAQAFIRDIFDDDFIERADADFFNELRAQVIGSPPQYTHVEEAIQLLLSPELVAAVQSDVGVGRTIARTPTPPAEDVGGAAEIHDDDNPVDPAPGPDSEEQLRGSKQALHGVKKAHTDAVISNANTMRDLFEARTTRQFTKDQATREAKGKWRNAQERLNQWYGYRATEADAQYTVDRGNVVCTVQQTIGDDAARDQLFTVTPRNDVNKRVVLNCHAESVIEPGLTTTGYMDLHQDGVYSTLQQSRYLITDALREMCSDPRFDGKPAIVFRVHLTNDNSSVIPKRSKDPSTDEDAIRLISLAIMAFNADPRVVVKLLPQEYNFLAGKRATPAVAKFLDFYDRHNLNTLTNSRPIHKFTATEVSALRTAYETAYVHPSVAVNKVR